MSSENEIASSSQAIASIDKELSKRFIALDPKGYFLISLDLSSKELVVEHYCNTIDDAGRAVDPKTGQPIGCNDAISQKASQVFKGRSAKEIGILLTEIGSSSLISKLDHALYLGRELQKAEECLKNGTHYIQD